MTIEPSDRTSERLSRPADADRILAIAVLAALLAVPAGAAAQQEAGHDHGDHEHGEAGHHGGLHFTHPMIAESVTPDTKIRLDHQFFEFTDGARENSGILEAEYAFTRSFSIEVGVPYTYSATEFGNASAMLKFANYAFEPAGVVLGYGVQLGFPTNGPAPAHTHEEEGAHEEEGHDHAARIAASRRPVKDGASPPRGARDPRPGTGAPPSVALHTSGTGVVNALGTDEWQVSPFLNVGVRAGPVELVGWGLFDIPFGQAEQAEVATTLSYNLSALYHLSSRFEALVELDGSGGISGEPVGEDVMNVSPGLRVRPFANLPLVVGSSVGFPLTNQEAFDVRWTSSVFWHFPR